MNQVQLDSRLVMILAEQGLSLESVPPMGTRVQLARVANISQGGTAIDCTERLHPDNRRLAEDIACLLGADVVGLDFISTDIGISWYEGGTSLIEANLSPGLRPHLVADPETDLCKKILLSWMGERTRLGRIPTALITGSIGKTTTSRLLAHLLSCKGLRVGLSSSLGMQLGGCTLLRGDLAGGGPALSLLQDRRVEAMVAEVARGGILKSGLGIDRVDVAAVLNVLDNHIGADGIRTRADLARIKSIVAQAADKLLVLNADDPLVLAIGRSCNSYSQALVSEEPGSDAWQLHRDAGHVVASYSKECTGLISLYAQNNELMRVPLCDIPASDDGRIGPVAFAAAFASVLAYGLDVGVDVIADGLRSFGLQNYHRLGRFEILSTHPYRIVLSWADGREAMDSISQYAHSHSRNEAVRRILLCSVPDSRPDAFVRQVGLAAWGFDLVIAASWFERQGRSPEEVPALLAEGVRAIGAGGPEVLEAGVEQEAVSLLAEQIKSGDLCVVSSFDTYRMRSRLIDALGLAQMGA